MINIGKAKIACGWDWEFIYHHKTSSTIEGNVLIPLPNSKKVYRFNMIWDKQTGLPVDVNKYPTGYYMRLIN